MNSDPLQGGAAATYNAASDFYDAPALSFRDRFGQATVARLELRPGARVLDICCGTGASALAAAEAVGPSGSVLGLDLAERQLEACAVQGRTARIGPGGVSERRSGRPGAAGRVL